MPDELDSETFYNLMQRYRWAGVVHGGHEEDVVRAFEDVKHFIRRAHADGHIAEPEHA